jgi:hypothetical protein
MTVNSRVEHGLDFSQYRTFEWVEADAIPLSDPRLGDDPVFRDRFLGAVEKELARRGVMLSDDESPDVLIHFHANISRPVVADYAGNADVYCASVNCTPAVANPQVTTLVIDIIDARTHRLVWRGWAQRRVADFLDGDARMTKSINEAVRKMLLRLPPGS